MINTQFYFIDQEPNIESRMSCFLICFQNINLLIVKPVTDIKTSDSSKPSIDEKRRSTELWIDIQSSPFQMTLLSLADCIYLSYVAQQPC